MRSNTSVHLTFLFNLTTTFLHLAFSSSGVGRSLFLIFTPCWYFYHIHVEEVVSVSFWSSCSFGILYCIASGLILKAQKDLCH